MQARWTRRPAVVVLVVGLVLAVVASVAWLARRDPGDLGADTARGLATATPATAGASTGPATPSAPPRTPGSTVPIQPGTLPSAAPDVIPTRLRIPAIGVDARVVPVALDDDTGEMDVPRAIDVVGWYRYGPGLAAPAGSAVVAGHVDDADQGFGAFHRLGAIRPGMRLTAAGNDGRTRTYRVVAREVFVKSAVPLDRLFARAGAPRLTLVTCGGTFDRAARSYRDNIVVTAVEEAGR